MVEPPVVEQRAQRAASRDHDQAPEVEPLVVEQRAQRAASRDHDQAPEVEPPVVEQRAQRAASRDHDQEPELEPPVVEQRAQRAASRDHDQAPEVVLIACGAIAQPASRIVAARGWPVAVHPLPPLLHNQPHRIAGEVEALANRLLAEGRQVAVGYADCGTYGALDEVCQRLGLRRLEGLHCYDVYAGASRIESFFADQPGTYLLTDFLVRSFARTVETELGLDRWPELREDYFRHYTRVVWLAQEQSPELRALAEAAAARLELPLTVVPTGEGGLESALEALVRPPARQQDDQLEDIAEDVRLIDGAARPS